MSTRPSTRGTRRAVRAVGGGLGLLLAAGLGAVVGHGLWPAQQRPAGISELRGVLLVATGMTAQELRAAPEYVELDGRRIGRPTLSQVSVQVPGTTGDPLAARLQKVGYRLSPEQEPECVSDYPERDGLVCTYRKGAVAVSVQIEPGPRGESGLMVKAASG